MSKEKLFQLLSALPDDALVSASFSFDRPYGSSYSASVTGVNFHIEENGKLNAVICLVETK